MTIPANQTWSISGVGSAGNGAHTITGGDSETRPANIALVYMIRATA